MAIIIDADVVIRGEKRTFDFRKWVSSHPEENFALAAVTVAELWHGVERATVAHRFKGGAESELSVSVTVALADAPANEDMAPATIVRRNPPPSPSENFQA